ncbi:lipopolysaccharide assembly protein LapB [Phenylobacterium aquaticum]|uniref:tetratricopeptide repeat protein n=1 Tax=Phenylobacterium aquaticum TaxID=1763816 RepID=UPI0026F046A5|nr:tetratricopeptide repeat protein [Phenylobacterium aquaticum]
MRLIPLALALALAAQAGAAFAAESLDSKVDALAHDWAHLNYEIRDKPAQAAAAASLVAQADAVARQFPGRAEPLVWEAIASATEAGAKGGLGGLALAKSARGLLERAEHINPAALGDGSVYTSLGSLYAQVPGFPIGFGDPAKARSYLQKALAANPNGVDANFFWGDFLLRQNDAAGAAKALERALAAPARPGREVADRGRRAEAAALLAQARQKLRG